MQHLSPGYLIKSKSPKTEVKPDHVCWHVTSAGTASTVLNHHNGIVPRILQVKSKDFKVIRVSGFFGFRFLELCMAIIQFDHANIPMLLCAEAAALVQL